MSKLNKQQTIYKQALQLAKKEYATYPASKKSRKAWNALIRKYLKQLGSGKPAPVAEKKKMKSKQSFWD